MPDLNGQFVRGELDYAPGAGSVTNVPLFDADGCIRTLATDERLVVTDISMRTLAATNLRLFFMTDNSNQAGASPSPTVTSTPAGTGIAAATYNFAYTIFDPFTHSETPLSVTNSVTPLAGDSITITMPQALPAHIVAVNGFFNVYRTDGGQTRLVGTTTTTALTITSVTTGSVITLPASSVTTAMGKQVAGGFFGANDKWSDAFETGKVGPPGQPLRVQSSAATSVMVHIAGRIIKNINLP